ncbi:MAG TPA: 4Fe-4S binding protein [Methanoregula sp.]|nr:4Fe-4S binding protein [Methanoregula sp.]
MAFAVHIKMDCTGCNNCVVACPVGARMAFSASLAPHTVAEVQ